MLSSCVVMLVLGAELSVAPLSLETAEDQATSGTLQTEVPARHTLVGKPKHGVASVDAATGALTYTPTHDYQGHDALEVEVVAGPKKKRVTVPILVRAVNDAPVVKPLKLTTKEDQPVLQAVGATDVDGDVLSISVGEKPARGTAVIKAGQVEYTPNKDVNGVDRFTLSVSDGSTSVTVTAEVDVTSVNDAPVVAPASLTGKEDEPATATLSATDADGDTVAWAISKPPQHGQAKVDAAGRLEFLPTKDWSGTDALTVAARDPAGATSALVVAITVAPVNDAPVVTATKLQTNEDQPGTATLSAKDVDGDVLSYTLSKQPTKGTATVSQAGLVTYTPNPDANGSDAVGVTVSDGTAQVTSTVEVSIRPVNDVPVATAATLSAREDEPASSTLSASDVDGDALAWALTKPPAHGTAKIDPKTGRLDFTPTKDWNGSDALTASVSDGTVSATVAVSITTTPVNDPPVAKALSLTFMEDESGAGALTATDVDGDGLTFSLTTPATKGTATVSPAGRITYAPNRDANGRDSFGASVSDGTATTAITVEVDLRPVNDAPVVGELALSGNEDEPATTTLTATDVDGDALSWTVSKPPSHGGVKLDAKSGALTFTPAKDWNGSDALSVSVSDGRASAPATLTLTIAAVNDAPVARDLKLTTNEDAPANGMVVATDVDGDTLRFSVEGAARGTASISATGQLTYTPNADTNGVEHLVVSTSDGTATTKTSVDVDVRPVNDAPTIAAASLAGAEDAVASVTLAATDVDGDAISWSLTKPPAHGTAKLDSKTGQLEFTPFRDWNGSDALTVTARDAALSATLVIPITVTPVNDTPVVTALKLATAEDTAVSGTVVATDVDRDALTFSIATPPSKGAATITATGLLSFTPSADANGRDTLVVEVSDGTAKASASVDLDIRPVNDPPVIAPVSLSGSEDTLAQTTATASDVDGDAISWSLAKPPAHGTARIDEKTGRLDYTPFKDWHGDDALTLSARDAASTTSASVSITIAAVNDSPVVQPLSLSTNEDVAATGTVRASDVDHDGLTFSIATAPTKGTATIKATGLVTYTPNPDANGKDRFEVVTSDGAASVSTTIDVDVRPVNDVPVVAAASLSGSEDGPVSITLSASDVDGETITWSLSKPPTRGTARVDAKTGRLDFTPFKDWNGADTLSVTARDAVSSTTLAVPITVAAVNDAPALVTSPLATREDVPVSGRASATDIDADPLRFRISKQGNRGQATIDPTTGAITYTPNRDANGEDTFTVAVDDGTATTENTVKVAIAAQSEPPRIEAKPFRLKEDEPTQTTLPAIDPDGDALTFTLQRPPTSGTVTLLDAKAGRIEYRPKPDFHGADELGFDVSDGPNKVSGVLSIVVEPVNDDPVAKPLALTTAEEQPVKGTVSMSDIDGDPMALVVLDQPKGGSAAVENAAAGTLIVTPDRDFTGQLVFHVAPGPNLPKAAVEVTVTVTPVNDPPVTKMQSFNIKEDEVVNGTCIASDVDGDRLRYRVLRAAAFGTADVNPATGAFTYTPRQNITGNDLFTIGVSDGQKETSATIALSIAPVDDPPVAIDGLLTSPTRGWVTEKLVGFDPEGTPVKFRIVRQPDSGEVTLTSDTSGTYQYAPDQNNDAKTTSFTFVVESGGLTSKEATVTIHLRAAGG